MRNLILFSIILLTSLTASAGVLTEMYDDIMNTVKLYCRPDQYFNPSKKTLIQVSFKKPVIGLCETDAHTFWTISIDMNYWNSNTIDMRYELMVHEMTHCIFLRNHVDNNKNYMYPVIRDLPKEETKKQFIENLKEDCRN